MLSCKRVFKTASVFLLALMCVAVFSSTAHAEIKVTVKNNRSHTLSLAFRWAGFDMPDDIVSGWYNVPAGQTKTFKFDVAYQMTAQDFGYYAQGGGSVWGGGKLSGWINPKSKFRGNPHEMPSGMKEVGYRHLKLKRGPGEDSAYGSATLTFNP